MVYRESIKAERSFKSCDDWWSQLSPAEKMWLHRYFNELPDPDRVPYSADEIRGTHDFNLLTSSATECGGADE